MAFQIKCIMNGCRYEGIVLMQFDSREAPGLK